LDSYRLSPETPLTLKIRNPQIVSGLAAVTHIEAVTGTVRRGMEVLRMHVRSATRTETFPLRIGEDTDFPEPSYGKIEADGGVLKPVWAIADASGEVQLHYGRTFPFAPCTVRELVLESTLPGVEVALDAVSFLTDG
jgi:hypothetical protein